MATPKREWVKGNSYHVTVRGNHRNDIFRDEEDFLYYIIVIEGALHYYSHFGYKIICYCLMDNHVHLMIKTENESLTLIMRRINSIYTKYFNKKYNYVGHLFQDKYFAEAIVGDAQMLETSRYVHLNPVKAKMVDTPSEYRWSSYGMLTGYTEEKVIDSNIILDYFKYENRNKLYKEFVELRMA